MKKQVVSKTSVDGFHRWKGAPERFSYLRDRHRHIFEIRCFFDVDDPDREIEFIQAGREIQDYLEGRYGRPCEFGGMSCEMIAQELIERCGCARAEVLEDGDGGAVVWQ